MISDLPTEIFGKSGGSHTNVFGVEIELLFLDSMVFMLPVMVYLSLDLIQFSKIFQGIRSAEIKFPNSHACFIEPPLAASVIFNTSQGYSQYTSLLLQ